MSATMSDPVRARSRFGSVWRLIALIVLLGAAAVLAPRFISIGYPGQVTTPELIGLVESIATDPDLTANVVLTDGRTVTVGRSDRSLGGLGELLFLGNQPERWHLAGHKSQNPDCYWISASRAYSEADGVVLAFEDWPDVGVRLPRAPGYDDGKLVTRDFDGRLRYSSIGPISLCADVEGQINGLP